ncbi:hypothetical protein [Piscinibacter koreensis]|uniref:Uncharacterized protein n=1 Tax=Piscinibacter koreensis TaxID=2742824 RepID=A0A7Y6NJJ0_9BURK|nr:hypothetical protein [Schlegelella koreensis]NUZ04269.1 hypothetical protein [Schlegelella koreensis]
MSSSSAPPPRPFEAVRAVLEAKGFELDDFELKEDVVSPSDDWIDGRVLRIRCISTGEERIYATGEASAWLGVFLMDLGRGHYAAALRIDSDAPELDPSLRIDDVDDLRPALA